MARRSFDIKPKKRTRSAPQKKEKPEKKHTHPRLATRAPKRKLKDRRREAFMRMVTLTGVAGVVALGAVLYVLWMPALRIERVEASGYGNADALIALAKEELEGKYAGVVPKNSFFFYPERAIRTSILEAYPAIVSVSVSRTSFTSLSLKANERVTAFWWCGTPEHLSSHTGDCYEADVEGLIFSRAVPLEAENTASTTGDNVLRVYGSLESASSTEGYPLRARVVGASTLPEVLRFVATIQGFGIPIASVALRGDEADLFVAPSTRITYVIGKEKEAAKVAEIGFPKLNLMDGSLEYVDLRFEGKMYLKRAGE